MRRPLKTLRVVGREQKSVGREGVGVGDGVGDGEGVSSFEAAGLTKMNLQYMVWVAEVLR